jgi:hypothetical protein
LLQPLRPCICSASFWTTSFHLVLGFATDLMLDMMITTYNLKWPVIKRLPYGAGNLNIPLLSVHYPTNTLRDTTHVTKMNCYMFRQRSAILWEWLQQRCRSQREYTGRLACTPLL